MKGQQCLQGWRGIFCRNKGSCFGTEAWMGGFSLKETKKAGLSGCLLFPLPLLFRLLLQLGIPPLEENKAAERNLPYALQCYEKTAGYVTAAMPAANGGVCIFTDGVRLWITHGLFNGWRRMRKRNMSHQRGIKRLKMPSGCTVLLM